MYNIKDFTDKELFQLMDLDSPSDRVLEMQIHILMNKYESMDNKMGKEMFSFFTDVYNHFFENEVQEDQEDQDYESTIRKIEGFENIVYDDPSKKNMKPGGTDLSFDVGTQDENTKETKQIGYTKSIDYTKGNLNPILKETIKRVISIDSQYRDTTVYKNSTDFTFNLSETLTDVVSLKLYSVQIPFVWYTINNNFGSNFFYINGITKGISDGNFNYKISIPSGNYQSIELASTIRESIKTLITNVSEVDFGTTDICYNTFNSKITMIIDIKNNFNEAYYSLYFPYITTYTTSETVRSIPQLFGYVNEIYTATKIYTSSFTTTPSSYYYIYTTDVSSSGIYTAFANNYFTIYNYQGPNTLSVYDSSTSLNKIVITLSISGNQTMEAIITDINKQLQSNTMLRKSSLSIFDTSNAQLGTYSYNLNICLNRKKVKNNIGSKVVVVFPENDASNTFPLWVGTRSYFKFPIKNNEVENIISELVGKTTNYYINSKPFVVFKCIHEKYTDTTTIPTYNNHHIYDGGDYIEEIDTYITDIPYTINDASFSIVSSLTTTNKYYTLSEYIIAIQNGMNTMDIAAFNCSITHTSPDYKISMNIKISNTIPFKEINLTNNFSLDISNCILHTILGFSGTLTEVSNTVSSIKGIATYIVTAGTTNVRANNTFTIKSLGTRNIGVPDIIVTITTGTYAGIGNLLVAINKAFASVSSYRVSMSNCYILSSVPDILGDVTCTLNLNIIATLTNDDYNVYLFDPSNNASLIPDDYTGGSYNIWDSSNNSWYNYLNFTSQMNLITNSAVAGTTVRDNDMILDTSNCYFYIKPISKNESLYDSSGGVYISDNSNDISFNLSIASNDGTIPALSIGTSYTKTDIISAINSRLSNNSITIGSYIDINTNTSGYTIFRLNINKTYTSKDYQLVFYDPATFTHCNFGYPSSTQNVTQDSTLGWLLGYRSLHKFNLSSSYLNTDYFGNTYYSDSINTFYTYDTITGIVTIRGDTSVNVNLYNYFLIILDDYTNSHLNDGLVTITGTDTDVPLPSYATRSSYRCDPTTSSTLVSNTTNTGQTNKLTSNQIYSANQILSNKINKQPYFSTGPYVQDIFGIIPIKTSGLVNGQSYIEFGGTLQIQERIYFGPVNIRRISVRLMTDKGQVLDLNGANWSFSLISEQLYNPNR